MRHTALCERLLRLDRPDTNLNTAIYAAIQGFEYELLDNSKGRYRYKAGDGCWVIPGEHPEGSGRYMLIPIPDYLGDWDMAILTLPPGWHLSRIWDIRPQAGQPRWAVKATGTCPGLKDSPEISIEATGFNMVTAAICFVGIQTQLTFGN